MLRPQPIPTVDAIALRAIRRSVNAHLRRFPSSQADREDLIQECALQLHQRAESYDPSAGSWPTFAHCVAKNRLASLRRQAKALRKRQGAAITSLNEPAVDAPSDSGQGIDPVESSGSPFRKLTYRRSDESQCELRVDVETIVPRLAPELQELIAKFSDGKSCHEIAAEMSLSRSTVYRRLQALQSEFSRSAVHLHLSFQGAHR
jgi:RNA polymerase sigma factor (sigma-70 family)